ncbi:cardiolipin synthase [Nocardioides sp. CER19]|uniref:cardiolipin synthase n=1 Tax=Nocardioides sp. CER19 TaxID=3038538 RepID=UPI00244B2882|nr:cardiolipin synthase [Nocardioides sp. CER19]MDH2416002.1 cardiolipin synthase [Nocardioides sp. CER19]
MPDWLTWLLAVAGIALVVVEVTVCVLALGVIPGGRKPSTGMAWLILILALPYVGILAFAFFGSTSVGRKRREWQRRVNEEVAAEARARGDAAMIAPSSDLVGAARLNETLGALPMSDGNRVAVLPEYADTLAAMCAEVERARSFVHVEFYITAWDAMTSSFFDALVAAAGRGVKVRLLFDHLGSRGIPVYKELLARLEGTGIAWAPMLPISLRRGQVRRPDLRNHRKILVVDGQVAFTGSQNLIEPGYNKPKNHKAGREWVEVMVRLEGPVVRDLAVVFATDWFSETGENVRDTLLLSKPEGPPSGGSVDGVACQVVGSGPGFVSENNLRLFNTLIYDARRRLSIVSPYFVPDESLLYAVTTAAQRGVDVELFVNEGADQFMVFHAQRSYYSALLDAGVRIRLYPSPYVLHAKFFTVDDEVAVVGSSNMDYRSFALNYEVMLLLRSREVVDGLDEVLARYRAVSTDLTAERWAQRGWGAAYVDNVMRLTAALQ